MRASRWNEKHSAPQNKVTIGTRQRTHDHFCELEESEAVWRASKDHVHRVIAGNTPADAQLLVASHGDDRLVTVTGRRVRHFPQNERGTYSGFHPADSAEAISALRDAQARGATFLAIPKRQLWWLDHYREFREHLENRHRVVYRDELCVLYRLQQLPDRLN